MTCPPKPERRGTPIVVVAAVIERGDAFLLTLRPDGTHLSGHWEFPGGKVHDGETHAEALRREIVEELDAVAEVGGLIHSVTHAYPETVVQLFFYQCELTGEPRPVMGQQMRWVRRSELASLPFPDADRDLIAHLVEHLIEQRIGKSPS